MGESDKLTFAKFIHQERPYGPRSSENELPCNHLILFSASQMWCIDCSQVEGPLRSGVVQIHMVKPLDKYEWEYILFALDVDGQFFPLDLLGLIY